MKRFLTKYWLILSLVVALATAGWQYWQIQKQAPVGAVPNPIYGGCKNRSYNDCAGCVNDKTACKWNFRTQKCIERDAPNGCDSGGQPVQNKCPNGCLIDSKFFTLYDKCIDGQLCDVVARPCDGGNAVGSQGENCADFWVVAPRPENCRPDPRCGGQPKVSPSPLVSPTPSPSPSPSPQTETGWIRVRKFNDRNQNGVKDWNEVSTGRNWPFKYRIANGPWQDYTTNAFTGVGPSVKVPANSQITVKEVLLGGWVNSTAIQLSELVTNNEVQWFTFGNYRTSAPEPTPSPEVSPEPSPYVSPTPVPTPEPGYASFVIRKFNDQDKDGYWDSNETPTGRDWQFQYRFNDGEWQDYTAWGNSGWGGIVTVGTDTKVEVNEIEQDGWTNTTGLTLIKILENSQVYYFDFGNFNSPNYTAAEPPVIVPEAGTGWKLQPWLVVAGIGVALQLVALLL